jgi:hypothetical protein
MANIPIWPGSSSFALTLNPTPYGFYDEDKDFREDADKVSVWCAQRLGYPLIDIELQPINFFSCFEESINEYGSQVYTFQIRNNLGNIIGTPTGSISSSLNEIHIKDDFGNNYKDPSSTVGSAYSETKVNSGSLKVRTGVQYYDLKQDLGSTTSGSVINIRKIYHFAPSAINRYFDPYAGTGTGIQSLMQTFGFGNYSPGVNFMLMPLYFDALKLQAIEFNDQMRKSAYHYEINGHRYLKLFPIPTSDYVLWYDYTISSEDQDTQNDPITNEPARKDLITNLSNVPYTHPTYAFINEPGRQWIRKYTLALAKEMLGSIRGKYQTIPIPGDTTTLDYSRLLDEARAEKETLIEQLREDLEGTTRLSQLERVADEANQQAEGYKSSFPYQIYIH